MLQTFFLADETCVPTLENKLNASNSDPDYKTEQQEKMTRIIEYAKFVEDTVKEMAKDVQTRRTTGEAQHLDEFLGKVGTGGGNDEILGFANMFHDQLTLRNISRPRLVNMCNYMGIQLDGTDTYLRYMLRKRLQWIKKDDEMIQSKGGVDARSEDELAEDCRQRGMLGLRSLEEMRHQLRDWLDISLNHCVPSSLMILSRATLPVVEEDSLSEKEVEAAKKKKKHSVSVESNKDVAALEEIMNATAAYAQQQLFKVSEALAVLASASSLSRECEEFLKLINKEINLYHSMMDKHGTDGASSALMIIRVDDMLQKLEEDIGEVHAMMQRLLDRIKNDDKKRILSKDALSEDDDDDDLGRELGSPRSVMRQQKNSYHSIMMEKEGTDDSMKTFKPPAHEATLPDDAVSTTRAHFEKNPMGPTMSSAMVLTLEKRRNDQPNVSASVLSSASNMYMSLVGDYNKYNYGDYSSGLERIMRATLSSMPDEQVIGITSLPSEDSEERKLELHELQEDFRKEEQSVKTSNKDVTAAAADAQQQAPLPVLSSASSVSEGGEQNIMKAANVPADGASLAFMNSRGYDVRVASTGPRIELEERASGISEEEEWRGRMEQRLLAQEVLIQDVKNSVASLEESVKNLHFTEFQDVKNIVASLEETVKKHFTELSAALLTIKPSSSQAAGESSCHEQEEEEHSVGVVQAPHEDEDEDHCPSAAFEPTTSEERPIESVEEEEEDHFPPVAQAAESSPCEAEDHFPCVFVQATSESRPTESDVGEYHFTRVVEARVSSSCVLDEEDDQDSVEEEDDEDYVEEEVEEDSPPVMQELEDGNTKEEAVGEVECMKNGWNAFQKQHKKQHKGKKLDPKKLAEIWRLMPDDERRKYDKKEHSFNLSIRCSPKCFLDPLKKLGPKRLKLLEDSPFHELLKKMMESNILQDNDKVEKYAWMFNTEEKCLEIEGAKYAITPGDFTEIMGVKDGEEEIDIDLRKTKYFQQIEAPAHIFTGGKAMIDMQEVVKQLKTSVNKDNVKRAFALLALRYIVHVPQYGRMHASFVNLVKDVANLNKIKWATYAIESLVDSIKRYKKCKGKTERSLGGCAIFLQLFAEKKKRDKALQAIESSS